MKAGIAIDTWKLPIFERRLKTAGYAFTHTNGVTKDTLLLYVETTNLEALSVVVQQSNNEAAKTKGGK